MARRPRLTWDERLSLVHTLEAEGALSFDRRGRLRVRGRFAPAWLRRAYEEVHPPEPPARPPGLSEPEWESIKLSFWSDPAVARLLSVDRLGRVRFRGRMLRREHAEAALRRHGWLRAMRARVRLWPDFVQAVTRAFEAVNYELPRDAELDEWLHEEWLKWLSEQDPRSRHDFLLITGRWHGDEVEVRWTRWTNMSVIELMEATIEQVERVWSSSGSSEQFVVTGVAQWQG